VSTILKQMAAVEKFSVQLKALKGFIREHDVAGSEGNSPVGLSLSDSTSSDEGGSFLRALALPKKPRSSSFGANSMPIYEVVVELNKLIGQLDSLNLLGEDKGSLYDAHQDSLGSKDSVKRRFEEDKFKPTLMKYESLDDLKALEPKLLNEKNEIDQEVGKTEDQNNFYVESVKMEYKDKVDTLIRDIESVQDKLKDLSDIKVDRSDINEIFNTLDFEDMKSCGVFDSKTFSRSNIGATSRKRSVSFSSLFEPSDNNPPSGIDNNRTGSSGSLTKYCELMPEHNKLDLIKKNFNGWLYVIELKLQLQKEELLRLSSFIDSANGSELFSKSKVAGRLEGIKNVLNSICKAFKGILSYLRTEYRFKFKMKEKPFVFYGSEVIKGAEISPQVV
jgi:hypothetical protein